MNALPPARVEVSITAPASPSASLVLPARGGAAQAPQASQAPQAPQAPRAVATGAALPSEPPAIDSATLLRGRSEVLIAHRGVLYRLKQTSLGKLILTK